MIGPEQYAKNGYDFKLTLCNQKKINDADFFGIRQPKPSDDAPKISIKSKYPFNS